MVHCPPEIYYARRLGMDALDFMDFIIAWGEANRNLLEGCPKFRARDKIRVLGNPRVDLLRPELSDHFNDQVESLRAQHGDFILINTNFGSINCYDDSFNLFRWKNGELVPGRGSMGGFRHEVQHFQASETDRLFRIALENLMGSEMFVMDGIASPSKNSKALNRHFPTDLQVCGDHSPVPPSREPYPLCSHPMV